MSLRASTHLSATFFVGLISLMAGCAHKNERVDCGGRDELLKTIFEFQFANNRSSIGKDADTYFIGLENRQDPDVDFLRRFAGQVPGVEPVSMAGIAKDRVVNLETGKPALIFQIRKVIRSEKNRMLVETGYYEAELSASWNTLQGVCERGQWQITLVGPEILS